MPPYPWPIYFFSKLETDPNPGAIENADPVPQPWQKGAAAAGVMAF